MSTVKPPFPWGVACAAYQVEGAWREGGRGLSIWDTFSHAPNNVAQGHTGDVAVDFYHRYQSDIDIIKALGVKMFRFSISWPRILPQGTGQVNKEGVAFYDKLINALLKAGIEPHITLYHWDLPAALQEKYGGWLSKQSIPDFEAYAEVCFRAFGDRVTHWTTFNEPYIFLWFGLEVGSHAPGRGPHRGVSKGGDSAKDFWMASHHVLLAHAAAVQRFRAIVPSGRISINFSVEWAEPLTSSTQDKEAAQRFLDIALGLYADPVMLGDYPASLRTQIRDLPVFTDEQRRVLKGSVDYFALNHYTTKYVSHSTTNSFGLDQHTHRNGQAIGKRADLPWLYLVPWGLRKVLAYVDARYNHPDIYITESGVCVPGEYDSPFPAVLEDTFRIEYYQEYLREAIKAVEMDGVTIKGYFAWSVLDNFEWAEGYTKRFGLIYVDYANGLTRHLKASAKWLSACFSQTEPAA